MRADTEHHAPENTGHAGTQDQTNKYADQHRAHRLPKFIAHDICAVRPHGHADADLAYRPAHTIGHHAIHANRGQKQSQGPKRSRQRGHDARGGAPFLEIIFELYHIDSDIGVERLCRMTNAVGDILEAGRVANQYVTPGVVQWSGREIKVARIELTKMRNLSVLRYSDHRIIATRGP